MTEEQLDEIAMKQQQPLVCGAVSMQVRSHTGRSPLVWHLLLLLMFSEAIYGIFKTC